eukprot:gene14504-14595_t
MGNCQAQPAPSVRQPATRAGQRDLRYVDSQTLKDVPPAVAGSPSGGSITAQHTTAPSGSDAPPPNPTDDPAPPRAAPTTGH